MRLTRVTGTLLAGVLLLSIAAPAAAAPGDTGALQLKVLDDAGTPASGKAWIRVLHGSPDAPEVDVYVGTSGDTTAKVGALSGLSFAEASAYFETSAGVYYIKVCATADATVCPIPATAFTLAANTKYTVVASNALADIEATVLVDGATEMTAGSGYVRVAHFSADTPDVDVLVQDKSAAVVDALPYKDDSGYKELSAGSYDLIVCADADNDVCPLDPAAITVGDGDETTIYAIGSLDTLLAVDATDAAPASSPFAVLLLLAGAALTLAGIRRFAGARIAR